MAQILSMKFYGLQIVHNHNNLDFCQAATYIHRFTYFTLTGEDEMHGRYFTDTLGTHCFFFCFNELHYILAQYIFSC